MIPVIPRAIKINTTIIMIKGDVKGQLGNGQMWPRTRAQVSKTNYINYF